MKEHSRYNTARKILIFWTLFIGVGAFSGAIGMLADPTGKFMGMDLMLPYFSVLPFSEILFKNYIFSGISLIIVNGITNLTAAVLLLKKKKAGAVLGTAFGVTLMLWICIQFCIFPLNFMSTAYFIFGFLQFATGYAALVFLKQENFKFDINNYKNIGTNKKNLVVFCSRMGYVKSIAYAEADKIGADILKIEPTENTYGTLGFWQCGRFGMHRWSMPIKEIPADLGKYEHITVCAPIWVFSLAAPVRSFCKAAAGKIKEADYIVVHHTNGKYLNAAAEMDRILGITHTGFKSIQCKVGKFKEL